MISLLKLILVQRIAIHINCISNSDFVSFLDNTEMADLMEQRKDDKRGITSDNCNEFMLLCDACQKGNYNNVKELMNSTNINSLSKKNGLSPLHIACRDGHTDIVYILVCDGGANVNLLCKDGFRPIDMAKEKGHKEISEFLKANGALPKK